MQNFIKNNAKSRDEELETETEILRDRDRDLRPSRPRLQTTGLETRLETETKSRDSITGMYLYNATIAVQFQSSQQKCSLLQAIPKHAIIILRVHNM